MSGGDEVCDDGQTQKCHPALIYDNVEKDCPHYTPEHCNFVAVFHLGMPDFAVSPHIFLIFDCLATSSKPLVLSSAQIVLATYGFPPASAPLKILPLPPGSPWRAIFL